MEREFSVAMTAAQKAVEDACEGELDGLAISPGAAFAIARHTIAAFFSAAHEAADGGHIIAPSNNLDGEETVYTGGWALIAAALEEP